MIGRLYRIFLLFDLGTFNAKILFTICTIVSNAFVPLLNSSFVMNHPYSLGYLSELVVLSVYSGGHHKGEYRVLLEIEQCKKYPSSDSIKGIDFLSIHVVIYVVGVMLYGSIIYVHLIVCHSTCVLV